MRCEAVWSLSRVIFDFKSCPSTFIDGSIDFLNKTCKQVTSVVYSDVIPDRICFDKEVSEIHFATGRRRQSLRLYAFEMKLPGTKTLTFFAARADEIIMQAVRLGAFQYLHKDILQSIAFQDEPVELRELCAQRLNLLLMDLLDTDTYE